MHIPDDKKVSIETPNIVQMPNSRGPEKIERKESNN